MISCDSHTLAALWPGNRATMSKKAGAEEFGMAAAELVVGADNVAAANDHRRDGARH
jgi:hypothetical protein